MGKTRIATVTDETHPLHGQRFIVQQWRDTTVHCWGQVTSYNGGRRRHEESIKFHQDSVKISETNESGATLSKALFQQAIQDLKRRGASVTEWKRNPQILRKPYSEEFTAMAKELGLNIHALSNQDVATINELISEE
ncbi:MAG: hypothetical protein ACWGQW_00705 [bacterium]